MKAQLNGITINYRDQGRGLPVVFIHAFPLNQTMWDDQISVLDKRFRTVTLDLRGFGGSDVPPGPYTMDLMASDVRALISHLRLEEVVLVGLSMGGYVSFAFYRNYPGAVRAMVLASTRAGIDAPAARQRRLKSAEKAEREGATAITEELVPLLLGDSTLENQPDITLRVRAMAETNSPAGIAAAQRAMAARLDSTYILAGIHRPVLILTGSEDKVTPLFEAEAMRNGIRDSRVQVITGAGHLMNIERPREFNARLVEFLDGIRR